MASKTINSHLEVRNTVFSLLAPIAASSLDRSKAFVATPSAANGFLQITAHCALSTFISFFGHTCRAPKSCLETTCDYHNHEPLSAPFHPRELLVA